MRPSHIAWILCIIAIVAFVGMKLTTQPATPLTSETVQKVAGTELGGPFALTNQDGKIVTDKSWPDKYLLVYFGFTHCPDICPVGLMRIKDALGNLPEQQRAMIQPLFITVDPARDTQKVLKEYVALFDAGIVGLTGSEKQINSVKKAYRVYAQKSGTGDDYMVNHSGYTYLMAPDGKLADIYAHETTAEELAAALQKNVVVNAGSARPAPASGR